MRKNSRQSPGCPAQPHFSHFMGKVLAAKAAPAGPKAMKLGNTEFKEFWARTGPLPGPANGVEAMSEWDEVLRQGELGHLPTDYALEAERMATAALRRISAAARWHGPAKPELA